MDTDKDDHIVPLNRLADHDDTTGTGNVDDFRESLFFLARAFLKELLRTIIKVTEFKDSQFDLSI
jgi:hypothetical protein